MRGTIKWQVTQLVKTIFAQGISKKERANPYSEKYQMVTQNTTMNTYKQVWLDIGNYVKNSYNMNDLTLLNEVHIKDYMTHQIEKNVSKQTLEKISAAIGKLEFSLSKYSKHTSYDFSVRSTILQNAKSNNLLSDGYHNRSYGENATSIIDKIDNIEFQLAAKLQLEGGARIGGIEYITEEIAINYEKLASNHLIGQVEITKINNGRVHLPTLQGVNFDSKLVQKGIFKEVGKVMTVEKGGKPGLIYITKETYNVLKEYILINRNYKIDRFSYLSSIKKACEFLNIKNEGSHGFRWTHINNRQKELILAGFGVDECLFLNSLEHKHWRASITNHYLGGH